MKQMILLLFFLTSCLSPQERAEQLIRENIGEIAGDFINYFPYETKIDSAFYNGLSDSVVMANLYMMSEELLKYDVRSEMAKQTRTEMMAARTKAEYDRKAEELKEMEFKCIYPAVTAKNADQRIRERLKELGRDFIGWRIEQKFNANRREDNWHMTCHYCVITDPKFEIVLHSYSMYEQMNEYILLDEYFTQDVRFIDDDVAEFIRQDIHFNNRWWKNSPMVHYKSRSIKKR